MYKINDSLREIENKEKKSKRTFYAVALVLLFILVLIIYLNLFVFVNIEVSGQSMESTLQSGDNLIAVRGAKVNYGDIIIIDKTTHGSSETTPDYYIIKRAIALGGDKVMIKIDGYVYVNGEKLNETYLDDGTITSGGNWIPIGVEKTLAEDEIFYMGDNRDNSKDARYDGPCKKSDVVGVVMKWTVRHKETLTKILNFFKNVTGWFSNLFGCGGSKS